MSITNKPLYFKIIEAIADTIALINSGELEVGTGKEIIEELQNAIFLIRVIEDNKK